MRNELRHTVVLAFGTGASSILRIAFVVYAARALGPSAYADLYAGLTVVTLFTTGIEPISGTVSRFTSLYRSRSDVAALRGLRDFASGQVRRLAIGLAAAAPVLAYLLKTQLSFESWTIPVIVAATLPISLAIDLPRGLLRGAMAFSGYGINLTVEAVARLVLGVVLITAAGTADAAMLAYFGAALLVLPLGLRQTRDLGRGGEARPADSEMLRRFGANFFWIAFIGAAIQNIDVLVARHLLTDIDAGLYSAASSLAKAVGLVYLPFGILLLPVLTGRFETGERAFSTLAALVTAFAVTATAAVVAMSAAGEPLLQALFGSQYLSAQPLLAPLGAAMVLALLSVLLSQAFTAMNRFAFVPLFAVGLVIELVVLALSEASLTGLAGALWKAQAITFGIVAVSFAVTARRALAKRPA